MEQAVKRVGSNTRLWRKVGRTSQTSPTSPTCLTCPTCPACPNAGYTLIELVSVAALAVFLIGIAAGGYHLLTRDVGMDAAQRQVKSSLARARAHALSRGFETRFVAINSNELKRCFIVLDYRRSPTNDWVSFTATNRLPRYVGVEYDAASDDENQKIREAIMGSNDLVSETHIYFNPDGTLQVDKNFTGVDDRFAYFLRLAIFHDPQGEEQNAQREGRTADIRRHLDISRLTGLVRDVPPLVSEKETQ